MDMPIIETKDLVKNYDDFRAVDGISFTVSSGECFGLLGPNGAGKSTTVKMITGLSPITSGSLKVFGLDVVTGSRLIKEKLGVVAQEDNLDPELTVIENMLVYAGYFKLPRKEAQRRAAELLAFMELENKSDTVVDHLSGGMKRRLTIARALINSPELLLLDEPTTGLDPHARHMVWQKIRNLKEAGTTVLLTTHYLEEASQLCDRLVFIFEGKIVAEGQPKDLIIQHIGSEVLELGGGDFDKAEDSLSQLACVQGSQVIGDHLHVFCADGHELKERLKALALPFSYQYLRPANLEDVFLKLTGHSLAGNSENADADTHWDS